MSAYVGRSRKQLPFDDLSAGGRDSTAADEIARHLRTLQDKLLFGAAVYQNSPDDLDLPEDVTKKYPYVRVKTVARDGERVMVRVEYGREGDYEVLLSSDGSQDIQLKGKATARTFRIWFIAPETGSDGFVVSETLGRTYAAQVLVHWLRVLNQRESVSFNEAGDREEDPFVRWHLVEAFDGHRVDDILNDSKDHSITLRRRSSDSGANRHRGELKLTQQGVPVSRVDDLKGIIRQWWEDRNAKSLDKTRAAARDLGTLIGASDATDKLEFNDGEITFLEKNKTQTISPNTIERLFVYPLGERSPSDKELLATALETLGPIAEDLKIEINTDA
ncbi:hypothetical protein [Leifsonia sp. Root227]|uniref:hypothetical protein n=1 Tax=Leifsonia sp. Root227 TaxID=1736496 RepID=UPI0012FA1FEA|nr:hypothetical protein [Leifsonia sp. Root227]